MAKPNKSAPLGQGGRYAALKAELAGRPGVTNPGALAAAIGRKKYGSGHFAQLAAKGRKRKKRHDSAGDTYTSGATRDSRGDTIRPGAKTDSRGDRLR